MKPIIFKEIPEHQARNTSGYYSMTRKASINAEKLSSKFQFGLPTPIYKYFSIDLSKDLLFELQFGYDEKDKPNIKIFVSNEKYSELGHKMINYLSLWLRYTI